MTLNTFLVNTDRIANTYYVQNYVKNNTVIILPAEIYYTKKVRTSRLGLSTVTPATSPIYAHSGLYHSFSI